MLGYAHGVEERGSWGPGIDPCGPGDLSSGNARQLRSLRQGIAAEVFRERFEALGPPLYELLVCEPLIHDHLHHPPQEVDVGSGLDPQVEIRHPGGGRDPRIGDDHLRPALLRLPYPAGDYGMSLGEVGAYGKDASGVFEVSEVVGHGSRPQDRAQADDGRRMAETGAVVYVR